MGPGQARRPVRKRNRKRKRRITSDSSSSEEDSSSSSSSWSSSDASTTTKTATVPARQPKLLESVDADESDDEEASSSSDESQDDSDSAEEDADTSRPSTGEPGHPEPPLQRDSPSPPPNADIPSFISPNVPENEQVLKEKFRKFWMASIAEGFKDDLEEIRKEPQLGPSRLALLIESLASGADVFTSSSTAGGVNEMEVILDQLL